MRFEFIGKNIRVREQHKQRVEQKLGKYEKYFHSDVVVHVAFSHIKSHQVVEITLPLKNGAFIRSEESTYDMLQSIDGAIEKFDRQIRKHKTGIRKRFNSNNSIRFEEVPDFEDTESEIKIVKTKNFSVKPMDEEEAVLQMNMLGHSFFVFKHATSDQICVVYKRKNGDHGLIETQ